MTSPFGVFSRNNRWTARTEDSVSRPVSSIKILSLDTPDSINKRAITDASDGPYRPTAPVGMKVVPGWWRAKAKAA